jgi:hypothetical protein
VKSTVSIPPVSSAVASDSDRKRYVVAWLLCLIFYSMEYASRSSPSVMVPELAKAFGTTAVGVAALLGTYYYTYSIWIGGIVLAFLLAIPLRETGKAHVRT